MIDLYFVRHGQTEWNQKRVLQGKKDSPLTAEGVEQAQALKKRLEAMRVDKCITSPLGRARETATLLVPEIPVVENELISEMEFGKAEGLEKEVFKERYPESFYDLWHRADRYDPAPFSGETFQSMMNRGRAFLDSLLREEKGSSILIISHGMMLKVLFALIWGHDLSQFWEDPVPLNTSLTHVTLSEGKFEIVDFSNVSHLDNPEVISYV